MKMELIFNSKKEIKCNFYTLAIRTAALRKKYPGGISAFVKKYTPRLNRKIVVICSMSEEGLDSVIVDIEKNELVSPVDFICYLAFDDVFVHDMNVIHLNKIEDTEVQLSAPWLKGYIHEGGVMLYYVDQKEEDFEIIKSSAVIDHIDGSFELQAENGYKIIFQDGTYAILNNRQELNRLAKVFSASMDKGDLLKKMRGRNVIYYVTGKRELCRLDPTDQIPEKISDLDSQKDRIFENSIRYLGDGDPKRYLLELCQKMKRTPYDITSYAVGGSHPCAASHVWAIYLREKGRPKRIRDCILSTEIFYSPAKTKRSNAWKGLAEIDNWLKQNKVI
jgi:hypothetical protein